MLKSISHGISAWVAPYQPQGLILGRRADMPCNMVLACFILFIICYQPKIVVVNKNKILSIWLLYRLDFRDVPFHCDVTDMHFLHVCWYWYAISARRDDISNCDVTNITPCTFCIITTKYMIKIDIDYQHVYID
jgi:hypothetical protein